MGRLDCRTRDRGISCPTCFAAISWHSPLVKHPENNQQAMRGMQGMAIKVGFKCGNKNSLYACNGKVGQLPLARLKIVAPRLNCG